MALTPGVVNEETLLVAILFKECVYYRQLKDSSARCSLEIRRTGEPHHVVISESEGWST